jgi:small multidrug resistance family-3 protein
LTSPSLSTIQLANTDLIVDYFKVLLLFTATAIAEIVGCYLPYLWLKHDKSVWLLLPASFSLALFVWLLTLHPAAAGRVYAAYGGVYVAVAVGWLWFVDGVSPSRWDLAGVAVMLTGATIIAFQPLNAA